MQELTQDIAPKSIKAALSALVLVAIGLCSPSQAQQMPADGVEGLNSTLWMQKSLEYAYGAEQVYRAAELRLKAARRGGTALIDAERSGTPSSRQPAIIIDLDETVLDNLPFQGSVVATQRYYKQEDWDAWVAKQAAGLVPGAKPFLLEAAREGFRIFYVTNRECPKATAPAVYPHRACPGRDQTAALLVKHGLPFARDEQALLMRYDQADWQTKTARRKMIGARYRVAMIIGDDLGDFLPEAETQALQDAVGTTELISEKATAGAALYNRYRGRFGADWFVLANPSYGSWERALGSRPACVSIPAADRDACYRAALTRKRSQLVTVEGPPPPPPVSRDLKLATWNVEWLILPEVYDQLLAACVPGQPLSNQRAIPCPEPGRAPVRRHPDADFAALQRYALKLDADVVALQEVDGPAPAARLFPGYDVSCFVSRAHPQKTGFAIRVGIPHRCNADYVALDNDGRSRSGADVTLFPGTPNEIRLLSIHLKSGCPDPRLDNTSNSACPLLRAQVPILEAWVDARVNEGVAFAVMGDFNRRLENDARFPAGPDERLPLNLFAALNDNVPVGATLLRASQGQIYVGCSSRDRFTAYVDNILIDKRLADRSSTTTFVRQGYDDADATLSDHCPVGVVLSNVVR